MPIDITPDEVGTAERVADKIAYRHPGIAHRDDIVNSLTIWMLENEASMRRLREKGHGLHTTLYRHGLRYLKAERAQVYGYNPNDQYKYSMAQVRDLLDELVVTGQRDPDGIPLLAVPTNESGTHRDTVSSNRGDPAFGGTRLVMLIDVHAGLGQLSPAMNARLRESVTEAWDEQVLAESWGVTQKAAALRVTRGLRKLSEALSEIRSDREHTGTRRAVTNEQARWAIRSGAPEPRPDRSPWTEGGVLT